MDVAPIQVEVMPHRTGGIARTGGWDDHTASLFCASRLNRAVRLRGRCMVWYGDEGMVMRATVVLVRVRLVWRP